LTASERVGLAVEMSEAARQIAIDGERRRHPELTEEQARRVVFRRMWGTALAERVPVVSSRDRWTSSARARATRADARPRRYSFHDRRLLRKHGARLAADDAGPRRRHRPADAG